MGGGNNYVIVRIPSNSELKKFLAYDFNSFDFNGTITDRKITFNMHKNPILSGTKQLENTYPQDNYTDRYREYFIGQESRYTIDRRISKSNITPYIIDNFPELNGYQTMTLVRPMIEYKE